MAQIISVSHDEAVTSLIGYVRKSDEEEVVLILPRRSTLIESLVNLRLLKREAEYAGKRLVIIAQDESAVVAAQRAGLVVREPSYAEALLRPKSPTSPMASKISSEKSPASRAVMDRMRPISDGIRRNSTKEQEDGLQQNISEESASHHSKGALSPYLYTRDRRDGNQNADLREPQEKKEEYLMPSKRDAWKRPVERATKISDRKFLRKTIIGVVVVAILSVLGWLMWKYVPSATLTVYAVRVDASDEISVSTSAGDDATIEIKRFDETVTITESFPATGSNGADTRRATGVVTIYNTHSEEEQPLVATTRLLTDDGKLYRLVESVVVPGKRTENGESIPGMVTANVKADEAGDAYNIGPSRFTIPGFAGSPKHDAFYAESEEAFLGGGSGGSETSSVSQSDIAKARESAEAKAIEQAKRIIVEKLEEGWMLSEDALRISVREADAFPAEGSVAETFEYSLVASVNAIVANTSDIEDVVRSKLFDQMKQRLPESDSTTWIVESVDIEYGEMKPNFESDSIAMNLSAKAKWRAEVDESGLKEVFLGKNTEEIRSILDTYSGRIEQVDVDIRPAGLVSRVSTVPSRVTINVR
jgi:hypothetical protein